MISDVDIKDWLNVADLDDESNSLASFLKKKGYKDEDHSIMDIVHIIDEWLPIKLKCDDSRYALGYNDAIDDLRDRLF